MFKDCKNGGYNLEECHAIEASRHSPAFQKAGEDAARLSAIVLLIAIAYTSAIIQGINARTSKVERYICRPKEQALIQRRHRNFWVGMQWSVVAN